MPVVTSYSIQSRDDAGRPLSGRATFANGRKVAFCPDQDEGFFIVGPIGNFRVTLPMIEALRVKLGDTRGMWLPG